MIFSSEKTKEMFSIDYDKYGDSYAEAIDKEDLRRVFNKINAEVVFLHISYFL